VGQKTSPSAAYPMFPESASAVTASDSVAFNEPSVVYVGAAGNVRVTTSGGDDVLFTGVQAGGIIPVRVKQVWATNTTASSLVRIY
jgi:hypothetical protein